MKRRSPSSGILLPALLFGLVVGCEQSSDLGPTPSRGAASPEPTAPAGEAPPAGMAADGGNASPGPSSVPTIRDDRGPAAAPGDRGKRAGEAPAGLPAARSGEPLSPPGPSERVERAGEAGRTRGTAARSPEDEPDRSSGEAEAEDAGEEPPAVKTFAESEESGDGARPPERRGRDRQTDVPDMTRRDYGGSCLSAGCHAGLGRTPWVHGPVTVGACGQCHEAIEDEDHDFRLTRSEGELCTFCHRMPKPLETVHEVYAKGDCTACHDPHGGKTRALLVASTEAELCGKCHEPRRPPPREGGSGDRPPFTFLHQPVEEGKCLGCHAPHQSSHPALMLAGERAMCLGCHAETAETLASLPHVHEPAVSGCRSCHLSHGSYDAHLLRASPKALCSSCHESVMSALEKDPNVHGALVEDDSCTACHLAHAASSPALVASPLSKACLDCHDRELTLPSGRVVTDIAAQIAGAKYMHEAVEKGDCQACHASHTSPYRALLSSSYPAEMYIDFSLESYQACFACHDERLVTEKQTTLTGFRDGTRNLHYVHVHREKGRSCRLCHGAHVGDLPKLMRSQVEYGPGGWKLPVRFEERPDGGSCASGCHKKMSYRRFPAAAPDPPPLENRRDEPEDRGSDRTAPPSAKERTGQ